MVGELKPTRSMGINKRYPIPYTQRCMRINHMYPPPCTQTFAHPLPIYYSGAYLAPMLTPPGASGHQHPGAPSHTLRFRVEGKRSGRSHPPGIGTYLCPVRWCNPCSCTPFYGCEMWALHASAKHAYSALFEGVPGAHDDNTWRIGASIFGFPIPHPR